MDVRGQLKELIELYFRHHWERNAINVAFDIGFENNTPVDWLKRRSEWVRQADFTHDYHISVDPARLQEAWKRLGTQALSGAVILDERLVSRIPGLGTIHQW